MTDIRKIEIDGKLYDLLDPMEYARNPEIFPNAAIEMNGLAYPVLNKTQFNNSNSNIGVYYDPEQLFLVAKTPDNVAEEYSVSRAINFSDISSMAALISKQEQIRNIEYEILTNSDNVTIPRISENDNPEMIALKQAIINKNCDINAYASKFAGNFANDRRILADTTITLQKLKKFCNALDLDAFLTIIDKSQRVANPMGENVEIKVKLTGGDE